MVNISILTMICKPTYDLITGGTTLEVPSHFIKSIWSLWAKGIGYTSMSVVGSVGCRWSLDFIIPRHPVVLVGLDSPHEYYVVRYIYM